MNHDAAADERTNAAIWHWREGAASWSRDELVVEEPLEIRVQGQPVSVTMRTPGCDEELALGFLLTEGVIKRPADVRSVSRCCRRRGSSNVVNVTLTPDVKVDLTRLTRHVFAASSCGLCGKATIEAVAQQFAPVRSHARFPAGLLASLPDRMQDAQVTFKRTGGLHAAALFDEAGEMLVLKEDVGRHNAVDKVLGRAVLNGWLPLRRHALVVSGRSSFEIMQKALAAEIPVVAAVSAPSSLAVAFAERNGQTLVGFVRSNRMNVYTHRHRITSEASVAN